MANVYVKTAASNLRQAISELQNEHSTLKANTAKQLNEIDTQRQNLQSIAQNQMKTAVSTSDSSSKAEHTLVAERMHKQVKELEKQRAQIQNAANVHLNQLDSQIAQYKALASQLDMQA